MNKKKVGIIVAAVVAITAAAGGGAWYFLKGNTGAGNSADKVYVESVASLTSVGAGSQNRYTGVVEAQETWKVNKDGEKEIKEVFVKEGDMVEEGSPLFEYDMEEAEGEIQQAELDLEGMQNDITNLQSQINQLSREKNAAPEEDKFEYTAEIQEKQNSIKQTEYNIQSKKAEIEKKKESIEKAVVTSKIAGVVKSINESGTDAMGESAAYMTVLASGDYRVKGTVSETNVQNLSVEQSVILRSRIDENQTWSGKITKIDTQNEAEDGDDSQDYMMGSDSGVEKATKYPFYVSLDSTEGLMMGQHLFIELDEGQSEQKEGIWLFEGYIVQEEGKTWVWADNGKNRLEKRDVELGEYDENLGEYQIVSGLTQEDAIAFPMDGLYEGVTTVTDPAEVDYTSPLYNPEGEDGEMSEDGEMTEDGEMSEDGEPMDDGFLMDNMTEDGTAPEELTEDGMEDSSDEGSEDTGEGDSGEDSGEDDGSDSGEDADSDSGEDADDGSEDGDQEE